MPAKDKTPLDTNEKHFSLDDFNVIKLLGEGNFGKVLMVNEKNNTNAYYAMKCLRKDHVLNNDDLESIVLERDISKKGQNNSHLIKLYGTFQSEVYNHSKKTIENTSAPINIPLPYRNHSNMTLSVLNSFYSVLRT